jgi:hypothetical protein
LHQLGAFQTLGQFTREKSVNQNKGNSRCNRLRPIFPTVIGATLNDNVTRAKENFPIIDQHPNLTFDHDAVVYRLGAVHAGMVTIGARRNMFQMPRMDVQNTAYCAAFVGRYTQRQPFIRFYSFGRKYRRGYLRGVPEFSELHSTLGTMMMLRWFVHGQKYRFSVSVMPGYDSFDGSHDFSSLSNFWIGA